MRDRGTGRPIDRRAILALLPAGLLAACSAATSTGSATTAAAPTATGQAPTTPDRTSTSPTGTSSTHPTTRAPSPARATAKTATTTTPTPAQPRPGPALTTPAQRARIVAQFEGRRPTRWGMSMPGITETVRVGTVGGPPTLALTFDACGGPGGSRFDADLIDLLRRHAVPATLFLNSRWIRANPSIAHDLMADPLFAIGNHGTRHRPLSVTGRSAYGIRGTTSAAEVVDEVTQNQALIRSLTGTAPSWFRTGTAWYDDVSVAITRALGVGIAGFAVNADAGATASPAQVDASLRSAPTGSIVIMHLNQPGHGTYAGVARALPRLLDRGTRFAHLA